MLVRYEKWEKQADGTEVLVETIENEVTVEDQIAEKEIQLMEIYEEIQKLKAE